MFERAGLVRVVVLLVACLTGRGALAQCPGGAVIFASPPNGVVDARWPHAPNDPQALLGIDTLVVQASAGAVLDVSASGALRSTNDVGTCGLPGDFDADGDVDLTDWADFAAWVTGPASGVAGGGLACGDFDADSDIDLYDTIAFCRTFTGAMLGKLNSILAFSQRHAVPHRTANPSNINISVQQTNGTNAVTVAPGGKVDYKIFGTLTDAVNDGLAGLTLDLHFTGGPLTAGNTPAGAISCVNPMAAFVKPDGITNPTGFGGTVIAGDLVQVGGHQNTIKNTADNAAFPIGEVLIGVAQPGGCGAAVIMTGSLTAPLTPGTYAFQAFNVAASVIKDGETGVVFWATEAAGIGTVTNLTIIVVSTIDDGLACTYDSCNAAGTCTHTDVCCGGACRCNSDIAPPFGGPGQVNFTDLQAVIDCINGLPNPACGCADINCDGSANWCDFGAAWCEFQSPGTTPQCCDVPCGTCCLPSQGVLPFGLAAGACIETTRDACEQFFCTQGPNPTCGTFLGDNTFCCPGACDTCGLSALKAVASTDFPPAGLDVFATGASFKVVMLDGTQTEITGLADASTVIGRSDPFFHGDATDLGCPAIFNGGSAPYPDTAACAPEPCLVPDGFPADPGLGHELHTQILSLHLTNGSASVKAGQPFFDAVNATPQQAFYKPSFGEVQGLQNDFPADSFFNVFVEVSVGPLKFYNKSPMLLRATITQFPPDLSLPQSIYLHDPSFPPTPLFDENGNHVAYLLSAGHGTVGVQPPPEACDPPSRLASPIAFCVDSLGSGAPPTTLPNHAMDDQGTDALPLTVYRSSGATAGAAPDLTNARTPGPLGSVGGSVPPDFTPGDAVNSLSWGRDGTRALDGSHTLGVLLFSVDRSTVGSACSAVGLFGAQHTNPEQAADIYVADAFSFGGYSGPFLPACPQSEGNCLLADQTILGLRPLVGETGRDNLTGLEASARASGDRFYGTFAATGLDPATMYAYDDLGDPVGHPFVPANLMVFASGATMGLQLGDSMDALALSDITSSTGAAAPNGVLDVGVDEVLFSLARGSPTLFGADGAPGLVGVDDDGNSVLDDTTETGLGDDLSAADILYSNFNGSFTVFLRASRLGLLSTDDVDAIDIGPSFRLDDCNCNRVADECDIARGISVDCNGNVVPDECELDGNDCDCNSIPDDCQLVDNDCNNNRKPDICDLPPICMTCPDCNSNNVPDICDISEGTSGDCQPNGVPDECDPDCQPNGVPDTCDIILGTSPDCDGSGTPDECEQTCVPSVPIAPDHSHPPRNRYLAFDPSNGCRRSAIRVTYIILPSPFASLEGQTVWVGPPHCVSDLPGVGEAPCSANTFSVAQLQCAPYYNNWAPWGTMYVTGQEVVPEARYGVQILDDDCDPGSPSNFSVMIFIDTPNRWVDTVPPLASEGAPGQPNFLDISALVDSFRGLATAIPKSAADVFPNVPDGIVNFLDISTGVDSFRGKPYPFAGPALCP